MTPERLQEQKALSGDKMPCSPHSGEINNVSADTGRGNEMGMRPGGQAVEVGRIGGVENERE